MNRLAGVLLALAILNVPIAAADEIARCRDIEAAHAIDFWIGDWDVADGEGATQGTNRIRSILDGCAIIEEWTGASGFKGRSLFYFDSWLSQWRQVWITAVPQRPGSFKEKRMIERLTDGGVRFQGEIMVSPEHYVLDRTTLRPLPDGRVHQHIEWSNDDGKNWQTSFEGYYSRRDR